MSIQPPLTWRLWVHGLCSAFIGGAAHAVTIMVIDPMQFNFQDGIYKLGTVSLVSAIVATALYLKQSPLP